jgi:hypothetical protein
MSMAQVRTAAEWTRVDSDGRVECGVGASGPAAAAVRPLPMASVMKSAGSTLTKCRGVICIRVICLGRGVDRVQCSYDGTKRVEKWSNASKSGQTRRKKGRKASNKGKKALNRSDLDRNGRTWQMMCAAVAVRHCFLGGVPVPR